MNAAKEVSIWWHDEVIEALRGPLSLFLSLSCHSADRAKSREKVDDAVRACE